MLICEIVRQILRPPTYRYMLSCTFPKGCGHICVELKGRGLDEGIKTTLLFELYPQRPSVASIAFEEGTGFLMNFECAPLMNQ
jgi:hypothetical protein